MADFDWTICLPLMGCVPKLVEVPMAGIEFLQGVIVRLGLVPKQRGEDPQVLRRRFHSFVQLHLVQGDTRTGHLHLDEVALRLSY